jgi:hypothetical protein
MGLIDVGCLMINRTNYLSQIKDRKHIMLWPGAWRVVSCHAAFNLFGFMLYAARLAV